MLAGRGGYPPFVITEFKDEDIVVTGMVNDILSLFEKRFPEYHRVHKNYPRKRVNKMMEIGAEGIDIMFNSPMFASDLMKRNYNFSVTVFRTHDVVITKDYSPFKYLIPKDLYGKRVGTILGYSYGEFDALFEQGKIIADPVNTHIQNLRKLNLNRVDAIFGNIHVSPYYMKQLNLDPNGFIFSESLLLEFDLCFFVTKRNLNLLLDLNVFINHIKQNGTLNIIVNNYIR